MKAIGRATARWRIGTTRRFWSRPWASSRSGEDVDEPAPDQARHPSARHCSPGDDSDINSIAYDCQNHRIRFYPSGGGSFVDSWTFDCDGAHVVASSVQSTTTYRNEGGAFGYFHIED